MTTTTIVEDDDFNKNLVTYVAVAACAVMTVEFVKTKLKTRRFERELRKQMQAKK